MLCESSSLAGQQPLAIASHGWATAEPEHLWAPLSPRGENTRSSANRCVFLFLLVHPWIYCLANQHSAHPHVRMVEGLRWEPVQILPASHLHPHAARPMYCDPSKGHLQPALHPPQTHANQEGLGEGEIREVCSAQRNRGVFEWGDL